MFQITEQVQGDIITLILVGQFDFHAKNLFLDAVQLAQSQNPREIVLNLTAIKFINSAGLGLLVLAKKKLPDPQPSIRLVISPGYVEEVLGLTNMKAYFPVTLLESTNEIPPPSH